MIKKAEYYDFDEALQKLAENESHFHPLSAMSTVGGP